MLPACDDTNHAYGSTFDEIQSEIIDEGDTTTEITAECIAAAEVTEAMVAKAERYRTASHQDPGLRNGVYLYSKSVSDHQDSPERLAARVALLGFDDVYLSPGKELIKQIDPWLRTFISTLKGYGINTHAIRITDNEIYVDETKVDSDIELIKTYNNSVKPTERFYGIAADLEPHTCKGSSKPAGLSYEWNSETNYGIGGANDMLLKLTLQRLQRAQSLLPSHLPQLNEAIAYNFQIFSDNGRLAFGSGPQFLQYCDWVVLMSYLATKEQIWTKSQPSLAAAANEGIDKSVSICVKTAVNDIENSESRKGKGWDYLVQTAAYILEQGKNYASFRGFDIFTYEGIEAMWEESN
jgi:hypothetical protein